MLFLLAAVFARFLQCVRPGRRRLRFVGVHTVHHHGASIFSRLTAMDRAPSCHFLHALSAPPQQQGERQPHLTIRIFAFPIGMYNFLICVLVIASMQIS